MTVISHNILAMNAQRQFGINTNNRAKAAEKLSSGYRINRAADDAAGLSISEKMRRQIRGLSQGVENTEAGVSLCQVADGALAEVNDMLHRITELSVKSANGTNSLSDRQAIQDEINEILTEIDRIGDTTTFNGKKLFEDENYSGLETKSIEGYKSEIVTTTNQMQKIGAFEFSVAGQSTDTVEATYTIDESSSIQTGMIIGNDRISWNTIKDANGLAIDIDNQISAGTYSFGYKGMNVSFEVKTDVTPENFVNGLKNLSWNSKKVGTDSQMNYSLKATTTADYTNKIDTYSLKATDTGIIVNDVEYSWPEIMKNGLQAGTTYDISAGDLQLKLTVGSNNTASFSEIIENIGTRRITETTRTSRITPISQMSIGMENIDTDIKTSNELIALIDAKSYVRADADGMWVELGGKTYNKISWADLENTATTNSAGLTQRVYKDQGLSFAFSTQKDATIDDIAKYINYVSINVLSGEGTHENVVSVTPADSLAKGDYLAYLNTYQRYFTYEELNDAIMVQNFSFTAIGDGTPTYVPDADTMEWDDGRPFIIEDPYLVQVGTKINQSYQGNILTVGNNAIVTENYELQNPDDLRKYFNTDRIVYRSQGKDSAEIDLIFKKGNSVISVKMVDKLRDDCTLDQFVSAVTGRFEYLNMPHISLVFTEDGEDVTYNYKLEVPEKVSAQVQYSQYDGTVSSLNKNMSSIMADSITNVPKYSYMEIVTKQEEIKIPIYGEEVQTPKSSGRNIWIQSGCDTGDGIPLKIDKMNTRILGINDLNVTSIEGAENAMTAVEGALEKLSENRSKIGAQQNRLEHTIANENNIVENTTASESRIRDVDMAEEMVKLSKNNILVQAGQAMMAQANQSNSGILNLLQ